MAGGSLEFTVQFHGTAHGRVIVEAGEVLDGITAEECVFLLRIPDGILREKTVIGHEDRGVISVQQLGKTHFHIGFPPDQVIREGLVGMGKTQRVITQFLEGAPAEEGIFINPKAVAAQRHETTVFLHIRHRNKSFRTIAATGRIVMLGETGLFRGNESGFMAGDKAKASNE